MKNGRPADFQVPWWYRTDLTVPDTTQRTYLDFSGVLSKADVWVNGTRVADKTQVTGAYTRHDLDITALVKAGTNSVAFKIYPNDPNKDLSMAGSTGRRPRRTRTWASCGTSSSGAAARWRCAAATSSRSSTGTTDHADLTVKADVRNDSAAAVSTTVSGTVCRQDHQPDREPGRQGEEDRHLRAWCGIDIPAGLVAGRDGRAAALDLDLTAAVGGTGVGHLAFELRRPPGDGGTRTPAAAGRTRSTGARC